MLLYRFSYLPLPVQSLVCNHVPHAFDLNILSHIIRRSAYMWCNDIELLLYASYFLSFSKQFSSSPPTASFIIYVCQGETLFTRQRTRPKQQNHRDKSLIREKKLNRTINKILHEKIYCPIVKLAAVSRGILWAKVCIRQKMKLSKRSTNLKGFLNSWLWNWDYFELENVSCW